MSPHTIHPREVQQLFLMDAAKQLEVLSPKGLLSEIHANINAALARIPREEP